MLQCAYTQGHGITHSLVERCVRSRPEQTRQTPVLHEVLNVTHLMVDHLKVARIHLGTHLDPVNEPQYDRERYDTIRQKSLT